MFLLIMVISCSCYIKMKVKKYHNEIDKVNFNEVKRPVTKPNEKSQIRAERLVKEESDKQAQRDKKGANYISKIEEI